MNKANHFVLHLAFPHVCRRSVTKALSQKLVNKILHFSNGCWTPGSRRDGQTFPHASFGITSDNDQGIDRQVNIVDGKRTFRELSGMPLYERPDAQFKSGGLNILSSKVEDEPAAESTTHEYQFSF